MSIPSRLKGFLDENQIPYSITTHAAAYTAQGAAATMQISGKELAKTVVLRAGEEMILAVLPAPNRVRLDKLGAEVGEPVRLGTEQEFTSLFPDCELGAMPLFTICRCMWMSRWRPMRQLSSTSGRTETQFACDTTTSFVWRNIGSARLLREGDADDFVVFLGGQCSEGFSPQFLSWGGKDGRVAVPFGRSRVCWVNLAIGAGRMRSRTRTPRSADPVNARR